MSFYLRLVIGPVVVCDIDLFSTRESSKPDEDPPPQLAGGQGSTYYPDPPAEPVVFGFTRPRRPVDSDAALTPAKADSEPTALPPKD